MRSKTRHQQSFLFQYFFLLNGSGLWAHFDGGRINTKRGGGGNGSLWAYLSFLCFLYRHFYMHWTQNSFFVFPPPQPFAIFLFCFYVRKVLDPYWWDSVFTSRKINKPWSTYYNCNTTERFECLSNNIFSLMKIEWKGKVLKMIEMLFYFDAILK